MKLCGRLGRQSDSDWSRGYFTGPMPTSNRCCHLWDYNRQYLFLDRHLGCEVRRFPPTPSSPGQSAQHARPSTTQLNMEAGSSDGSVYRHTAIVKSDRRKSRYSFFRLFGVALVQTRFQATAADARRSCQGAFVRRARSESLCKCVSHTTVANTGRS